MEYTPKTLLKVYLALQIFTTLFVLELGILQNQQPKISIDRGIFAIAYATEILHGEKVKTLHSILL